SAVSARRRARLPVRVLHVAHSDRTSLQDHHQTVVRVFSRSSAALRTPSYGSLIDTVFDSPISGRPPSAGAASGAPRPPRPVSSPGPECPLAPSGGMSGVRPRRRAGRAILEWPGRRTPARDTPGADAATVLISDFVRKWFFDL